MAAAKANLIKAGTAIKKSFRTSRYSMVFGAKENYGYVNSPKWTSRRGSEEDLLEVDEIEIKDEQQENQIVPARGSLRSRGSVVTQSMREAVGNIRQKLRMSTRRRVSLKEQSGTPTKGIQAQRRQTFGGVKKVNRKDVKMSSPFVIDTPTRNRNQIKTCISLETPTRLRREVEALTSNMQALSALTPNTLQTRSTTRRSPPLTNGSLKTPRSTRKKITTEV